MHDVKHMSAKEMEKLEKFEHALKEDIEQIMDEYIKDRDKNPQEAMQDLEHLRMMGKVMKYTCMMKHENMGIGMPMSYEAEMHVEPKHMEEKDNKNDSVFNKK